MGRREDTELDRELAVLPPELRWREWMRRIEAVLFASTTPVAREDLARVVGQGASVDLLIEDLAVDLEGRPYEVAQVGAGVDAAHAARPMPQRSAPRRMWTARR
jgi:segregation and condensation protein B